MKAKDTLLLNNTITQNPILARRAWFWRVASHICYTGLQKYYHTTYESQKMYYCLKNIVYAVLTRKSSCIM